MNPYDQTHILFICPTDSTVHVSPSGEIPKVPFDGRTNILFGELLVNKEGVDVYTTNTYNDVEVYIVSVTKSNKRLAAKFFNAMFVGGVWLKCSAVEGRNHLLDSALENTNIHRVRKGRDNPLNTDDSKLRHNLQQAANKIHALSTNIELNSTNIKKIEKLIKAVDDLTNDDSGLERITNIVLDNEHIVKGLDIKTHLDIPAQIEEKINSAWIKRLHDQISARCIREDSVVSDDEMYILHFCLDNANTKLKESQRLTIINTDDILGNRFDSRTMKPTKPTVSGRVARVLLPGIKATEIMKSVVEVSQ